MLGLPSPTRRGLVDKLDHHDRLVTSRIHNDVEPKGFDWKGTFKIVPQGDCRNILQLSGDPPQIHTVHCHLHGLFTHHIGIALWRWLWCISSAARLTAPALTARIIQSCFDLLSALVAIWTWFHPASLPASLYLDTPQKLQKVNHLSIIAS